MASFVLRLPAEQSSLQSDSLRALVTLLRAWDTAVRSGADDAMEAAVAAAVAAEGGTATGKNRVATRDVRVWHGATENGRNLLK
jgi:hypothetical protein